MHTYVKRWVGIGGVQYAYDVGYLEPHGTYSSSWRVVETFNEEENALAFVNYLNGGTGGPWNGKPAR